MSGGAELPRREFLYGAGAAGVWWAAGVVPPHAPGGEAGAAASVEAAVAPSFPRNDLERVRSVVGASHGNMDVVRTLVSEQPALAKASWDWGFGDWETCLGAASHTGRREIAEFLIGHGARPTLFSAAMLGQLATVRAWLDADPGLYRLHGPHGISLMRHARAGREDSAHVVEYLLDRFGDDPVPFGLEGTDALQARYGGRFDLGGDPPLVLAVGVVNGWLMVGVDQPGTRILPVEGQPDTFHPTGAPAVRLRFRIEEGRSVALTVHDGPVVRSGDLEG